MSWENSIVAIDGQVVDDPRISVFDRGFLFGDSVFEVFRTRGGLPHALGEHLLRLERSAEAIAMALPTRATLLADLRAAVSACSGDDRRVRLVVTRGVGSGIAPSSEEPMTRVVIAQPLRGYPDTLYSQGAAVHLLEGTASGIPGAKVSNYLPSVLATAAARERGAHEALLCDSRGLVREGATSNFFLVRDGRLVTPPVQSILPGVTRAIVIALAEAEGLALEERPPRREELRAAEEAFLTSTIRGLMPITKVDGKPVGVGSPGPLWRRLRTRFEQSEPERLGWPQA